MPASGEALIADAPERLDRWLAQRLADLSPPASRP